MESARRAVFLGASNVTTGLPVALAACRARLGPGPLTALVAAGHGRSYGRWSRVLWRGLPGILDSGVWRALTRSPDGPTWALVTDIGNDLAYGVDPAELIAWVSLAVDRLGQVGADVVLTLLPASNLGRLPRWRYHLLKGVLFPGRRLPFPLLMARVSQVNDALGALGGRPGVKVVAPQPAWYGFDPIHLRRGRRPQVFADLLAHWSVPGVARADAARGLSHAAGSRYSVRGLRPEQRTLWGVARRQSQPGGAFPDGLVVSLF